MRGRVGVEVRWDNVEKLLRERMMLALRAVIMMVLLLEIRGR